MQTIMVVDDKANVRTLLREYLTEQGYRVVTAENGRVALFTARQEKPDIILLAACRRRYVSPNKNDFGVNFGYGKKIQNC
ncbi:MAG: response regulator [Chloroflexi bacterium]|nr:response regulator [Chloroflexota bacterium]